MLLDQSRQPFFQHVGIDLCCGNICMPEHLLKRPQISAISEKMAGKGMPENMG